MTNSDATSNDGIAGTETADARYERGLAIRREVLGEAHVNRSLAGVSHTELLICLDLYYRPVQPTA